MFLSVPKISPIKRYFSFILYQEEYVETIGYLSLFESLLNSCHAA